MNLTDEFERAIGTGPEHRSLALRLAAGRQAVLRRRGTQAAAAAALLAVVTTTFTATVEGVDTSGGVAADVQNPDLYDDVRPEDRRHEPTLSRDSPVGIDLAGGLVVLRGVIVRRTVENPMGLTPPGYSMGVEFELDRQIHWRLLHVDATSEGAVFLEGTPRDKTFGEWVSEASRWAAKNRDSVGE